MLYSLSEELPGERAVKSLHFHAPYWSILAETSSKAGPR